MTDHIELARLKAHFWEGIKIDAVRLGATSHEADRLVKIFSSANLQTILQDTDGFIRQSLQIIRGFKLNPRKDASEEEVARAYDDLDELIRGMMELKLN